MAFGALGFLAQGRATCSVAAIIWSASGIAVPLLTLIALYYRVAGFERSIPFAGLALLLAALFGWATELLGKRSPRPGLAASGALYATGTVAALALTLTFALEKGWLTVALALMVPGIAWIANQRPWPMLRALAAAAAVLVVARVAWEPRIMGADVGSTPIFNWILYGYGVPAIAFWLAGYLLRKRADDLPTRMVESAAILFTALTALLEIRHFMNGGDIYRDTSDLGELALQVCLGLAMTIGLEHVRHRTKSVVHNIGALVIAALTACGIVFGLWMFCNPLFTGEPVGSGFFNLILLGYGIPAVLAIVLAMRTRDVRPHSYRVIAAAFAVLLMLSYLSLEVRAIYHGTILTWADHRRRAIHLFGGLARLRRGAAAVRHRVPLATGAARLRRDHAAHHRQGVRDRHGGTGGRLPRAVVHRARAGAGRNRLALPAAAVSAADAISDGARSTAAASLTFAGKTYFGLMSHHSGPVLSR